MNIIYQSNNGQIIHGDNIEVMKTIKENSVDSCISDFPYDLSFMGRKWDTTGNFYEWCKARAVELYRIMKPGGYVCIFGHPKTNHRMKCAFEDVGFQIVEEIDWIYLSGMPKNQDIGKMFDKHKGGSLIVDEIMKYLKKYRLKKGVSVSQLDKDVFGGTTKYSRWYEERNDGRLPSEEDWFKLKEYLQFDNTYDEFIKQAKREKIGEYKQFRSDNGSWATNKQGDMFRIGEKTIEITLPSSELAKTWDGWKTAGLKPAHEPITVFQKPIEKNYCYNIEKYGCGAMNIDACRVPINPEVDDPRLGGKGTWSTSKATKNIYEGGYKGERVSSSELGRFPPNVIFDEYTKDILDEQTGIKTNTRHMSYKRSNKGFIDNIPSQPEKDWFVQETGGGSRMFPIIKYCPKVSPKERLLPNGERNPHVTLKPKELIKWLIKLVTPKDGTTIDITAGSCTHAVAVEELNRDEGYNLKYIDIELMNTETEPYCDVGKMRVESIVKNMS